MDLHRALKISEFRTAMTCLDQQTILVEQVQDGYLITYGGTQHHFSTFDALTLFLEQETIEAHWTPVQQ